MINLKRRQGASRRGAAENTDNYKWHIRLWSRRLSVVLVLALFGVGVHWICQQLLDSTRFPLRYVHLYGELRFTNKTELQETLIRYPGQNFFLLDIDRLRTSLTDVPWIEKVKVQRYWPDGIVIQLKERQVFARWGDNQLLDIGGHKFQPNHLPGYSEWPLLYGPDGNEQLVVDAYRQASAMLLELGLKINHMVQDQRLAWWLTLNNGVKIKLGKDEAGDEQLIVRLRRLIEIYPKALASRIEQIAAIDMRYSEGFSVLWADPAETIPLVAETVTSDTRQKSEI